MQHCPRAFDHVFDRYPVISLAGDEFQDCFDDFCSEDGDSRLMNSGYATIYI